MATYEYRFERVDASRLTWSGFQVDQTEYQHLIRQHAKKGWRFVQIFAPSLTSQGRPKYYELIFEREVVAEGE